MRKIEQDFEFEDRNEWPFADMPVGGKITLGCSSSEEVDKAQRYAHAYGNNTNKKFRTRRKDLLLMVQRIA